MLIFYPQFIIFHSSFFIDLSQTPPVNAAEGPKISVWFPTLNLLGQDLVFPQGSTSSGSLDFISHKRMWARCPTVNALQDAKSAHHRGLSLRFYLQLIYSNRGHSLFHKRQEKNTRLNPVFSYLCFYQLAQHRGSSFRFEEGSAGSGSLDFIRHKRMWDRAHQ